MCIKKINVILVVTIAALSACGGSGSGSSTQNNSSTTTIISSSSSSLSSSTSSVVTNNITQCELLNFKSDETISYRLPILFGQCPSTDTSITIEVAGEIFTWPVLDGFFKGAVLLDPGSNDITLTASGKTSLVKIIVAASQNVKKVQMVYAIATDDDGHFLAAEDESNDIETAKKHLAVEALMLQSAMAQMMYKAVGKHKTFTLVEDENGVPEIQVFQVSQTRETLYAMDGLTIYYSIQDQLKTETQNNLKYMVTMGFSGYENGQTLAHTALGGSNLALFGGLHLHTCPKTLEDISASFSNEKTIDTRILPDDSAGRGTYWANCATGMGASLHELGHSFELPHSEYGIMSRGFDRFNRLFMISEPAFPSAITPQIEYDAVWHPESLTILAYSVWITQ